MDIHISIYLSIYLYIYIYIYIYECMCVGMCVCLWMGGQRRILSSASLASVRLSRESYLSILDHTKSCAPREPAGPEEKDEGRWWVRSETPK